MATKKPASSTKTKEGADVEINAKWNGNEFWKDWGKEKKQSKSSSNGGGPLYFVGFIGSLVYWMQAAVGFGAVLTGVLKAMVWPAYIVYKLLENFYGVV